MIQRWILCRYSKSKSIWVYQSAGKLIRKLSSSKVKPSGCYHIKMSHFHERVYSIRFENQEWLLLLIWIPWEGVSTLMMMKRRSKKTPWSMIGRRGFRRTTFWKFRGQPRTEGVVCVSCSLGEKKFWNVRWTPSSETPNLELMWIPVLEEHISKLLGTERVSYRPGTLWRRSMVWWCLIEINCVLSGRAFRKCWNFCSARILTR